MTIAKALRLNTEAFEDVVEAAIKVLVQGGIVALPTDTIYGVSTLLEHSDKLYRLKNRPQNKPLGLFVSSVEEISRYAELTIPHSLASSLLPGPVTLIFNRSPQLPSFFNAGVKNVGVRVPNTSLVQAICSRLQQPLAQTSANVSGSPMNPLKVEDFEDLLAEIDLVIDGGEISQKTSLGSTIVDLTEHGVYKIMRDGCAREPTEKLLHDANLVPI